jgi:multidrug efflux pump subunit AcrA (membrane-fusion protein)
LREQALPVWFRIISSDHPVAVGQPVKVTVRTMPKSTTENEKVKSVTVSRQALTKNSSGETVVWVHPEAERFVARKVQLQALDADRVMITAGLQAGERLAPDTLLRWGMVHTKTLPLLEAQAGLKT